MNRLVPACVVLAGVIATPNLANACGGCFTPPPPPQHPEQASLVTDHRMVFAISEAQTTLWDQIRYSGSPADFVWVLPVANASTLRFGLADDRFVNAVDQFSAPEIIARFAGCAAADGGGGAFTGCGASNGSGVTTGGNASESTRIMRDGEAIVGPYDVSVISTDNGSGRLDEWLGRNGYAVPDATRSAIDYYVGLHFDFIALRLAPGAGVQEMQPVRITTRGYSPILPLRMVAAGIGDKVGLSLMVIASTRVEARGFDNVEFRTNELRWDPVAGHSNYRELFSRTLAEHSGRAWVIESVQTLLESDLAYPITWQPRGHDAGVVDALSMPWLDAASDDVFPMNDLDGGDDASMMMVPRDGGPTEMDDAGVMQLANPFIDRTTAFEGLGTQAIVTRMRTELGAADLATDLVLDGTDDRFVAAQYVVPFYAGPCPQPSYACAVIGGSAPIALEGLGVVALILHVRRRRRSRRAHPTTPGA
jgi:hypothetical protein